MLSSTIQQEKSNQSPKEEIYLNFNHRPQRIIIYNLIIFLWSISNLLFYSDAVSQNSSKVTLYHRSTNYMLLVYNLILCIASCIVLFTFYFQFKVQDINVINISFRIAGNLIELPCSDFIFSFVGLIYFLSFLLHIGITWKMATDVCSNMEKPTGCIITIISSTLLSILFPVILCADIIDNVNKNPTKRILLCTLFIFLATFIYIWEFQANDFGRNSYYLSSYIRFSQTSFYLISSATAIIFIVILNHHQGILVICLKFIVSFILLCSPIVAYGCHIIEFNGIYASHPTWFIIVTLSICISYDIQKLDSFNIFIIGAQSTVRERFITQPPTYDNINTPSVYKKQKIYKGNSNGSNDELIGDHIMYGSNEDFEDSDFEENDKNKDDSFNFLVFKKFSFNFNHRPQRLLIFNTLLLIYNIGYFIYYFNFWINFDALINMKQKNENFSDYNMNLQKTTYVWYCISFVMMIIISICVIFMEWFVLKKEHKNKFKFYKYSCGLFAIIAVIFAIIAVILGTNDYCKHLSHSIKNNNGNYYCHMQYVGTKLIFLMLPLCICVDIIRFSKRLFDHTRVRIVVIHFIISLSSIIFYVGFYNYYNNISSYLKTKLIGHLMITFSFIFGAVMSPLFLYLQSQAFSNVSNLISSLLIIIGASFVLDVNDLQINIAEWSLFIPMCCLIAYENCLN